MYQDAIRRCEQRHAARSKWTTGATTTRQWECGLIRTATPVRSKAFMGQVSRAALPSRGVSSMSFLDKAAQRIADDGRDWQGAGLWQPRPRPAPRRCRTSKSGSKERVIVHSTFDIPPDINVRRVALNDHERCGRLGVESALRETKAERTTTTTQEQACPGFLQAASARMQRRAEIDAPCTWVGSAALIQICQSPRC